MSSEVPAPREQLLMAISHELRAPLATIKLWIEVLRGDPDPQLRTRAIDALQTSAALQERLVTDLLDFARALVGKLRVDPRVIELAPILEQALAAILPAAAEQQVTVVPDLEPDLGIVIGDADRLRQVLGNLLGNAVKFTEPGGMIRVTAARRTDWIVIRVADTGCGIGADFLGHALEPFTQESTPRTDRESGLGLGLAIAHELVLAHGGHLAVSSAGSGQGTTFTVSLPAGPAMSVEASNPRAAPVRLDGLGVLVVDDDPHVLEAMQILLRRAGARVDIAGSAAAARAMLARELPDAMLCDVVMPGEDGCSLVRGMRQHEGSARDVPVIAFTAHLTGDDRLLAAGFDALIAKPVDIERLIGSIADLVATRRAERASGVST